MSDIDKINEKLAELGNGQKRILGYMESDDKTKSIGLVEKANQNSKRLYELELDKKIEKRVYTIYGVIGGGLAAFVLWFAKLLITKNF